jgi:uncharacterized protein (TIGR02391 family)
MNLQTKIDERLWDAIRSTYEANNFSAAILDAIHFLSELIRERSGLDGDGANLVGRAFGGKTPILKVNSLNTESERNVQAGIEQLLRGIYQAVRNPRSHGTNQDTEEDAVAIILFINHMLKTIDLAKAPFSQQVFIKRILDPDFVPKKRYAELLVAELPQAKRLDVFHGVFNNLKDAKAGKIKVFFEVLLGVMTEEEKNIVVQTISESLRDTDETEPIRLVIQAFPHEIWPSIAEISRLRIEHKLVQSVIDGKYYAASNKCRGGAFGTWASEIAQHFTTKADLLNALANKLASSDQEDQEYVFQYFSGVLTNLCEEPTRRLAHIVNNGLKVGDIRFKNLVENYFHWSGDEWISPFKESLDQFEEAGPVFNPDDDIPF